MPIERVPGTGAVPLTKPPFRLRLDYGTLTNRAFAVMTFCGAISVLAPSPYDFASVAALLLWLFGGFRIHPLGLLFASLIFVYNLGGFIALMPHLDESMPVTFMLQSLYLAVTAVFFALFFGENTERRAKICLSAFAASTVVAAGLGTLGYFNVVGTGTLFSLNDRAAGTFKDPNVLGSYLIMGALFYMQALLLGRARRPLRTGLALLIVVAGVFLSFSRGSWLAFAVAMTMLVVLTILTAPSEDARRRAMLLSGGVVVAMAAVLAVLLSVGSVATFFLERFSLTQDYDVGETGRFGNQLRSLSMLLDRANGFGPLRFRLVFGLDPHNSFINAFASYGWLGAAAFFLLVGLTLFIGFRLAFVASPYRRLAQVFWPALFVFLLQGLQIDIDHWRHVYLMLGAVWGLETARLRWRATCGDQAARTAGASPLASVGGLATSLP